MKKVLLITVALMLAAGAAAAGHTGSSWANASANGGTSGWGSGWGDEVQIGIYSYSQQVASTHTTSATPGDETADAYAGSDVSSSSYGVVYSNGGSAMIVTGASGYASASSSGGVQ